MSNFTSANSSTAPPPSPVARPHNSTISPLTAVLCLISVIVIPMIAYILAIAIRCPRNPLRRHRPATCKAENLELAYGIKYRKSAEDCRKKDASSEIGDCPVCLSAFADGDEIRQLSGCDHAFHAACIDTWLTSHSNCPVCRAAVPVKRSRRAPVDTDDDFRQGLPDAADLI